MYNNDTSKEVTNDQHKQLIEAIDSNDINQISIILLSNPDLLNKVIDLEGNLPIHYFASQNSSRYGENLGQLLTMLTPLSGVSTPRSDGHTALYIAQNKQNDALVNLLQNINIESVNTNDITENIMEIYKSEQELEKKTSKPLAITLTGLAFVISAGAYAAISWGADSYTTPGSTVLSGITALGIGIGGALSVLKAANKYLNKSPVNKSDVENQIALNKDQALSKQITPNYGSTDIHAPTHVKISHINSPLTVSEASLSEIPNNSNSPISISELSLPEAPNNSNSSMPVNRERSESSFLRTSHSERHRADTTKNPQNLANKIEKIKEAHETKESSTFAAKVEKKSENSETFLKKLNTNKNTGGLSASY